MKKGAAVAITLALCVPFLALPAGLEAKGRRGALIILTKLEGAQIRGELISVGPNSLLLRSGGEIFTVPRPNIQSVTIMRRSRKFSGALTGLAIGAGLGISWGIARGPDRLHGHPAIPGGAAGGFLGSLIGMTAGRDRKVEAVIGLAGLAGPAADERWNALGARSREGRRAAAARRR